MALIVLVLSFVCAKLQWTAVNPTTNELIVPINLLSREGVHNILENMVVNFTGFAPLGIVLVAMLGIGLADDSGLINTSIRLLIAKTPPKLVTFVIVFAGVMSNITSDAGHIIVIPLAGIIFLSIGRHPVVGIVAAFAGVSGCYSANMLLGTLDPLLAGLSTEAAHIISPNYEVSPTGNYYFLSASAIILSFTGTWITEKIIAPRFPDYKNADTHDIELKKTTKLEKKGLITVAVITAIVFALLLVFLIPENSFFRGDDGSVISSPLLKGVIAVLFLMATSMGIIYGVITKKYKSDADIIKGMSRAIKNLDVYIVMVFFASQFVAFFKMSNLGIILAVKGATFIRNTGLELIPLTILFILFSTSVNMLIGSASAKWTIMAPIFVPMFMLLGYSPEFTQVAYRIGDSASNVISPMLSFFPLIITFIQKYEPEAKLGTIIATMFPYFIIFLTIWIVLIVVWIFLGFPIGPGAEILLTT